MLWPDCIDARSTRQSGAHRGGEISIEVETKGHCIALKEKISNHDPALSVAAISHQKFTHPINAHLQLMYTSNLAPVVSVLTLTVTMMKAQVPRMSVVKDQLKRELLQEPCVPVVLHQ